MASYKIYLQESVYFKIVLKTSRLPGDTDLKAT